MLYMHSSWFLPKPEVSASDYNSQYEERSRSVDAEKPKEVNKVPVGGP